MSENQLVGDVCRNWWNSSIAAESGSARKARAELRRCVDPIDVLCFSITHDLNQRLIKAGYDLRRRRDGPDRLALVAAILAQVRANVSRSVAHIFGTNDLKTLSELRFNTLIREKEPRRLISPLARAIKLVKGTANVSKLATDLYWWNDRTRADWCFDYYGAASDKPKPEKPGEP